MSWFFNMYDSNMHGERVKMCVGSLWVHSPQYVTVNGPLLCK
jgi:hypothetical protein